MFALPFAYLGMVLAARGWPGWHAVLWITVAMVAARTTAMAANRLIDRQIDARNPRTAGRHLPRGTSEAPRPYPRGGRCRPRSSSWRRGSSGRSASRWRRSRSSSWWATPTRSASRGSPTGSSGSPTARRRPARGSRCAGRWRRRRGSSGSPSPCGSRGSTSSTRARTSRSTGGRASTRCRPASGSPPRSGPRASPTSSPRSPSPPRAGHSGSASSTGSAGAWWSGSSSTSTRSCPRPTSRGSTWPSST